MKALVITSDDWAERINARWQTSLTAILETGRLIADAKEALPHGEFEGMVQTKLRFSSSTARRLMIIAEDPRLSNRAHVHALPPHWGTLYELTKLDDRTFKARIRDGTIRPDMERKDVAQFVKNERRVTREVELARNQYALPDRRYGVLYADPPWRFEPYSRQSGMNRAPENHYPTMSAAAIAALDVPAADDCALFLWATSPMLPDALVVVDAWGFTYKSHIVWVKDRAGTGYWARNKHELLLIAARGDIPAPAPGQQPESVIHAPRGRHSEKPEVFHALIERMFPRLPKLEMFARAERSGWDSWGNEVEASAA